MTWRMTLGAITGAVAGWRWLGLAAAALALQACAFPAGHPPPTSLDQVVDFAAARLGRPRPENPELSYHGGETLRRICGSDWGCQAFNHVFVRDVCRDNMRFTICHLVLAHEVAHYVLHETGAHKGDRHGEDALAEAVADAWLRRVLAGGASSPAALAGGDGAQPARKTR